MNTPPRPNPDTPSDGSNDITIQVNKIQLLLAEKRTALSVMRTGIAVFALPLSVFSILIATSNYYNITKVLPLIIPVLVINTGLVGLAVYLVVRSIKKLHALDMIVDKFKNNSQAIADLFT